MKRLRHPATIIASLALFVALGGGAWGASTLISGSHIKNHSIAAKKLTRHAIRTLRGRRGPVGPQGPVGPAGPSGGTARAFAHIKPNGTFDESLSSGISATSFKHNGAGRYCFSNLGFTSRNVVATIDAANAKASLGAVARVVLGASSACPAGTEVAVLTSKGTTLGNFGVYVLFN